MNPLSLPSLEACLTANHLTEKGAFGYLLANWLVFGMAALGLANQSHDDPGVILFLLLIPTIGLLVGFRANQRGDGRDFLKRFISLHFVIGIRFLVIAVLLVLFAEPLTDYITHPVVRGWTLGILMIIAPGVGFYYFLYRSMKKVSGRPETGVPQMN